MAPRPLREVLRYYVTSIGGRVGFSRIQPDTVKNRELSHIQYVSMRSSLETYGNSAYLAQFRLERAKLLRDSIPPLKAVEQSVLLLLAAMAAYGKPARVLDFGGGAITIFKLDVSLRTC